MIRKLYKVPSAEQQRVLERERAQCHHEHQMALAEINRLVEINVPEFDHELALIVKSDRNNAFSSHIQKVTKEHDDDMQKMHEVLERVGCKGIPDATRRVNYYMAAEERFGDKFFKFACTNPKSKEPCLQPVIIFNAINPRATISQRSLTKGRFAPDQPITFRVALWLMSPIYRQARHAIKEMQRLDPNWQEHFSAYEKWARQNNYYMLRHRRAQQKIDMFKSVQQVLGNYLERSKEREAQLNSKKTLPLLQEAVGELLHSPVYFDQLTAAWPKEAKNRAKRLTYSTAANKHRIKIIDDQLKAG